MREQRSVPTGRRLKTIKFLHTLAWAFFAGCIFAIPIASWYREHRAAAVLAGLVLVEVLILALNHWSCPLTAVAARYTQDRRANFDIYLPEFLARYNKQIFGCLYVASVLYALANWVFGSQKP